MSSFFNDDSKRILEQAIARVLMENTSDRTYFSDLVIQFKFHEQEMKCAHCMKLISLEKRDRSVYGDDAMEAHHKDGNHANGSADNCVLLCYGCHKKTFGE